MKTKKEIEATIIEFQEEKKELLRVGDEDYNKFVKKCLPLEKKRPELFEKRKQEYLERRGLRREKIEKIDTLIFTLRWVLEK